MLAIEMAISGRPKDRRCSIAEARDRLPALVHEVEQGGTVELARRGRPVAVLVSLPEYRRLRADGRGFWDALARFRRALDLKGLAIEADVFAGVRDRTPGRPVR